MIDWGCDCVAFFDMCDECRALRGEREYDLEWDLAHAMNENMKLLAACSDGRRLARGSVPPGPGQPIKAHEYPRVEREANDE